MWVKFYVRECSSCLADLDTQITLEVPVGIDYDLVVYSPCGTFKRASSLGGYTGHQESVSLWVDDVIFSGDDSLYYYVHVDYHSGTSCAPWKLTLWGRVC
jgi:hypothetical protein